MSGVNGGVGHGAGPNETMLVQAPFLAHEVVLAAMRANPKHALVQTYGCNFLANILWNRTRDGA